CGLQHYWMSHWCTNCLPSVLFVVLPRRPGSTLFPTRRSSDLGHHEVEPGGVRPGAGGGDDLHRLAALQRLRQRRQAPVDAAGDRSEEHTSELQSRENLVCRLLLEKKNDGRGCYPAPTGRRDRP